jgi:hypothetical protein
MGLEGIVSKRLTAPYRSGPSRDWLKIKNPDNPAMVRHREDRWQKAMDEIEAFLDECRADSFFQSHPEVIDRLESVLTKFYLAGEDPAWQAVWDQLPPSS